MAANATGGKGGQSAYNNQVVTLLENNDNFASSRFPPKGWALGRP